MRIVFIGTGDIGLPALKWLIDSGDHELAAVVTQPDKPVGRRQQLTPPPAKELAERHSVPVFQPEKIREPAAVEQVRGFAPDVIVVMAYGQILPGVLLEVPRIACINLHASLLPRHRGAAPVQAAIEAGDSESGITIMYVGEGLDTGDILLQRAFRLRRRETGGSLHDRISAAAPEALEESLRMLDAGNAPRIPQDDSQATYAAKLTREHGRIDWSRTSREIERKVRAMNPWPGAFTEFEGASGSRKMKVFSAIPLRRQSGEPGEIIFADARGIAVGAGSGAVLLKDVQLEGKRRMSAREFLRGNPLSPGKMT